MGNLQQTSPVNHVAYFGDPLELGAFQASQEKSALYMGGGDVKYAVAMVTFLTCSTMVTVFVGTPQPTISEVQF